MLTINVQECSVSAITGLSTVRASILRGKAQKELLCLVEVVEVFTGSNFATQTWLNVYDTDDTYLHRGRLR